MEAPIGIQLTAASCPKEGELGSQDRQVKGRRRGFREGVPPFSPYRDRFFDLITVLMLLQNLGRSEV